MGRLIPAGTGLAFHQERRRKRKEELDEAASLRLSLTTAKPKPAMSGGDDETAASA